MILARASGPRLEHDGIAAGMSGIPDLRRRPARRRAGVRLAVQPRPAVRHHADRARCSTSCASPTARRRGTSRPARRHAAAADPAARDGASGRAGAGLERLRTPLDRRRAHARGARAGSRRGPRSNGFLLAAGGVGSGERLAVRPERPRAHAEAARAALEPGAAVSVDLMRGDMNLSAIGTLTWRDGDRVRRRSATRSSRAATCRYPLALADITTIVASDLQLVQDGRARRAGGHDHAGPPRRGRGLDRRRCRTMLPLTVTLHGPRRRRDATTTRSCATAGSRPRWSGSASSAR